jgi:hypothetical protein
LLSWGVVGGVEFEKGVDFKVAVEPGELEFLAD